MSVPGFHSPRHPGQKTLEALALRIARLFSENGLRLASAESCTGGWAAQCLTAIPGSSAWFDRGFVCYSNDAKREMLGVPAAILKRHGAVSEPAAAAMASGALHHSRADWALSVTGIAGPDGGTPVKPKGTVCFGWANHESCETLTYRFDGSREAVRAQSVFCAFDGLVRRVASTAVRRP
ncbi:MAG: CinA family protein [Candidatus Accumulibacter sp.]|jgi:nicotinamide-nucleotide amidase|nr:CinA family protein [Accumulibacter sp.]